MAGEGIGGQREGAFRNLSGCAICAIFERSGGGISGGDIIQKLRGCYIFTTGPLQPLYSRK